MEVREIDCMKLAIECLESRIGNKQDLLVNGHLLPGMDTRLRREIFSLITAVEVIKVKWNIE